LKILVHDGGGGNIKISRLDLGRTEKLLVFYHNVSMERLPQKLSGKESVTMGTEERGQIQFERPRYPEKPDLNILMKRLI